MAEVKNEIVAEPVKIDVVKASFNMELQKAGLAQLQSQVDTIKINEDNIAQAGELITKLKALKKIVEGKHKEIKEPHWKNCVTIDSAKREIDATLDQLINPLNAKYTTEARRIDELARRHREEEARKLTIKDGIDKNILAFAQKIANCSTSQELVIVERQINFEKIAPQNLKKFGEFYTDYTTRLGELNESITEQKNKLRELEKLNKKVDVDDDEMMELEEKKMELEASIEENRINVQETAINAATKSQPVDYAVAVVPEVKAKRSVWKWEVENISETAKKMPNWTVLGINEELVDQYLKAKKVEGIMGDEFTFAGIRFFLDKTY